MEELQPGGPGVSHVRGAWGLGNELELIRGVFSSVGGYSRDLESDREKKKAGWTLQRN